MDNQPLDILEETPGNVAASVKRSLRNMYFREAVIPYVVFLGLALFGQFFLPHAEGRFVGYGVVYIIGSVPHIIFVIFNLNIFLLRKERVYSSRFITTLNRLVPMLIPGIQFWLVLALWSESGGPLVRTLFVLLLQPVGYFITVQWDTYQFRKKYLGK